MLIALIAVAAIALVVYLVSRLGNPGFWNLVGKNPDAAYQWFLSDDCWVVLDSADSEPPEPASEYVGPFYLFSPAFGGERITIYGHRDRIEDSERRFIAKMSARAS